ncbi:MAG: glycosyltransferase [Phycisphaerales bacterium]|nr:MAG: glycosyltransferase [Phycisphaerales bacterium]
MSLSAPFLDRVSPDSAASLWIGGREPTDARTPRSYALGGMRIAFLNWARPWDGAARGGGVNGYAAALALELRERGHELTWLCAGSEYAPSPDDPSRPGEPYLARHPDWLGVRVLEVVNSPVLAPSMAQFEDPLSEVEAPALEALCRRVFGAIRPDVLHVQTLEGWSLGCLDVARELGSRVVFSLHNYHTICPQVYLTQGHRVPCHDNRRGHACAGCIPTTPKRTELRRRLPVPKAATVGPGVLKRLATSETTADAARCVPSPSGEGGEAIPMAVPVSDFAALARATPRVPDDPRGETPRLLAEREPCETTPPGDPALMPITNEIISEPEHEGLEANAYGRRREAMLRTLNACDAVLAVSEYVRARYASLGVASPPMRVMGIGTRMTRIAAWQRELLFDPPAFVEGLSWREQRPVRAVFMGYNNWQKGLPMLCDALEMLSPEELAQIDLSVYAFEGRVIEWRFRRLEPRLARLHFHDVYKPHDVPWMCGGKDFGLVPSVWWDNGPQTVMEFLACGLPVVGAELGGIPDLVRHGENGLLFRGNDREDLARTLREIVRTPTVLNELRRGGRPPKSIEGHAAEIEDLYGLLVEGEPAAAADPRATGERYA